MSFKQKNSKKNIYRSLILALFSLILSFSPQTVMAKSLLSFFSRSEVVEASTIDATEEKTFPIIEEREPLRTIRVTVTAYSSDVDQTDSTPCIPASGKDLCKFYEKHGYGVTIAANFLRLGRPVRLPGLFDDKVFIVEDRMNAKYNYDRAGYYHIDVWMPTAEEARQFGVKRTTMEVY